MIKVFEDFELSLVGRMQSLLESEGIRTFLKNEFSSGVLGELPFVEIVPQLYVIEQSDVAKAKSLIGSASNVADAGPGWQCASCKEMVEGNFDTCWNCSTEKPAES
jgi:hypothetical protein